ncbi:MAG TPA: LamG-like jellyroll fold domain-containing protein, partial [Anaerolineae bacterium]|nr:LamG-like jellyroll fold domain-containing protein [Anaerolineae bacterium]
NNVDYWIEESDNWEWYEGAYSFLGVNNYTANGPTYKVNTPLMALPCLAFNGSSEHLPAVIRNPGGGAFGSFKTNDGIFAASAKTIIMAIYVEGASANSGSPWLNHGIVTENRDFFGIYVRNDTGTYKLQAYNYDGTIDVAEVTISLNTSYVVCVRHDGVNLYISLDGGTETSVASGPTTDLYGRLILGANGRLSQWFQGRIGEIKTWNSCLTGGTLTSAISAMTTKW